MKLLIKYPTRNRPELFKSTLQRYLDYLSGEVDTRFIISIDKDDSTMNNGWTTWRDYKTNMTAELLENICGRRDAIEAEKVEVHIGTSTGKVSAINRDIPQDDWDILLVASDDMIPQVKGYDRIIMEEMYNCFPDTDGALWFNDGRKGNKLWTLPVLGRRYYDRFGYVYHPSYQSLYCDNEAMEVAQSSNKLVWNDQCIIKHEWQTLVEDDELYRRNEAPELYEADWANYASRRAKGFPK